MITSRIVLAIRSWIGGIFIPSAPIYSALRSALPDVPEGTLHKRLCIPIRGFLYLFGSVQPEEAMSYDGDQYGFQVHHELKGLE